jgi:hypothetical protein
MDRFMTVQSEFLTLLNRQGPVPLPQTIQGRMTHSGGWVR